MGILEAIYNVVLATGGLVLNVVYWLAGLLVFIHTDMPRLEGLMIGILFAWVYVHREKNAFVRIIAAPMKIIIDILDIVWDETIEAVSDVCGTVKDFVVSKAVATKNLVIGFVKSTWERVTSKLDGVRNRLKEKE